MNPKCLPRYPIYIVSKGRHDSRKTIEALYKMRVPYRVVIEPQQLDYYKSATDESKILLLPFSNLGLGSIPARNWIWEHSISEGWFRHWIMDDNISGFCRLNKNMRIPCDTGGIFRAAEEFTDRYENIAFSGLQYRFFAPHREKKDPFTLNTRIYSCILIRNDLPYRWRGRYNEDTDLSIRALKDGWCTVLFNAFLCDKAATMTMRGGNTDELYSADGGVGAKKDGRLLMAESLRDQHPDIVTITRKWNRWQHHVDYNRFAANELKLKRNLDLSDKVNEFGMRLRDDENILKKVLDNDSVPF